MISSDPLNPVANGYMFLANIFSAVKIEKLIVPEVAKSGSNITLDCLYSVPDNFFTMTWLYNNNPVYRWKPYSEPEVMGVLEERLDLSFRVSQISKYHRRSLRILQVDPSLSGEYTCVVLHNGMESRLTKTMLIYSSEDEFELKIRELNQKSMEITCSAVGLFPQPDILIEYNNEPISQQSQRVWHHNKLYKVEGRAKLIVANDGSCNRNPVEVTCRVYLPQVDYTAIKKRFLTLGNVCNGVHQWKSTVYIIVTLCCIHLIMSPLQQ